MKALNSLKAWTVLLYAAGRNELEPEIAASVHAIAACELPSERIGLAVQLARPPGHYLALLRPMAIIREQERWTGVRRFLLDQGEERQMVNIGCANMAEPETLADFLCWGMESLPSQHLMVIISGHGAGFLGLITDYDRSRRSLMSIKGFTQALAVAGLRTGRKIDVLVLDACYMQMVEIWHELAQKQSPVDSLITPLGQLRLGGMNLPALISGLASYGTKRASLRSLLARIIGEINASEKEGGELMLVRPDARMLGGLKELLGLSCRIITEEFPENPGGMLSVIDYLSVLPCALRRAIGRVLTGLCLAPPAAEIKKGHNLGPCVLSPASADYRRFQPYYDSLLFAQNNPWMKLKAKSAFPASLTVPLTSTILTMLSQNPGMTEEQAFKNAAQLGWVMHTLSIAEERNVPSMPPTRSIII